VTLALTAVLVGTAVAMALCWLGFDAAGYRPLRRAIARGDVDVSLGPSVRRFGLNALGGNPDIDYRYLPFDIPPGHVGVLRGRIAPGAEYYSVVLYDRVLQSQLPERCPGPTWRAGRDLTTDDDGRFVAILDRADRDWTNFLDISAVSEGVVFERHIGAAPEERATLHVVSIEAARHLL
jgi:hypothetical protein